MVSSALIGLLMSETKDLNENELTQLEGMLKDRLTALYAARRGLVCGGQVIDPAGEHVMVWAWCVGCGQVKVQSDGRMMSCRVCTNAAYGRDYVSRYPKV